MHVLCDATESIFHEKGQTTMSGWVVEQWKSPTTHSCFYPPWWKKKLKNLPKTGFEPATFKLQHDILWALAKLFVYKTKKICNLKLHWWLKSCTLDSILRLDSFLRDRWEIYDLWSVGEFLFLFWAVERQLSLPNQTINYFWSFERQTLLTAHSCFYPSLNLLWAVGKNDNFWIFSHRS